MCPGCVVNPQVERITRGSTSTYRMPGSRAPGIEFDLVDLFDSIFDLFRR